MNILHLTDLHYNSDSYEKFSQDEIISALCDSLKTAGKIDIIIFTGDLVYKGNVLSDFHAAKGVFIDKILEATNLTYNDFFICSGNHDIDRSHKLPSLEQFFESKINTLDDLYSFIKAKDQDYLNSILTTNNYNFFVRSIYNESSIDKLDDLFSVHIRKIRNKRVGIISLNSSWRSVDDTSYGKLLFPVHLLEEALSCIKDSDVKLVLMHHPIHWFKDFNQSKLQELIYKSCDIMFSGHVHESEMTAHFKYNNGIFANVSSASMTYDKNYIGYTLIEYDLEHKSNALVTKLKYINEFGKFISDEKTKIDIPCGEEKKYQNDIRAKLNSKLSVELSKASELLLANDKDNSEDDLFLKLFNKPVLKTQSKAEIGITEHNKIFDFDKLLINENNYLIYGHDKSGKSTLLKFIQITHLTKYSLNGNIPFYIDFRELEGQIDQNWDLIKHMSKYFELSYEKTRSLIERHHFRLLIDNFDPHSYLFSVINDFLIKYTNINFVICCDNLTSRILKDYAIDDRQYQKLYLHDITRSDVRTYLNKNKTGISNTDWLIDKIVTFCKQIELPLNYWTISIILLIHKKSQFDISKNIFNMLDLCVDEILNKKYLTLTKSKLDFKQLKSICGKLSKHLLTNYSESIYSAEYVAILTFLEDEIGKNVRLRANSKEILDYLISSGVLKIKDDSRIAFRLNGIFEYFLAYQMSQDEKFKMHILNEDAVYLSFKNEMEIYSGIKNNDIDFLQFIYKKTSLYFQNVNEGYHNEGTPDENLQVATSQDQEVKLANIIKSIKALNPLSEENKDLMKDDFDPVSINSNIEIKKVYNPDNMDSEIFERYVSVLARVYKTMDGITDENILNEILDFLLITYINFGFYLANEVESNFNVSEDNNTLELLNKFMPLISQITFSDSIANYNVEGIILAKIEDLKKDYKNNQYKLFILYFILMDIDESNILKYTDELLSLLNIGVLRYTAIMKLNYYFTFNGNRNQRVAEFLRQRIETGQLQLNDKIDKNKLKQSLDKKKNLIKFTNRNKKNDKK